MAAVDLSRLPAPDLVDELTFEEIRDARLADLVTRMQVYQPSFTTPLPSDPSYKETEVAAYRELLYRRRVNEAALATMLAFAKGPDLDAIGAFPGFDVPRLVLDEGDPEAVPPVDPIYEDDEDYRLRIQAAMEGYSTAGAKGAYEFWAMSADADVKDAVATSPNPCEVTVTILSRTGDGTAGSPLLAAVDAALNAEEVRPLGDELTVQSATIITYTVEAELTIGDGPDSAVVQAAAEAAVQEYVDSRHAVGALVSLAGIYDALFVSGVVDVSLTQPASNVAPTASQAAYCTGITVTVA